MVKLFKVFCKKCKKPIYRIKGRINENIRLRHNFYCSKKCEYEYKTKKKKFLCENCGKEFLRQPKDISPHNYCSRSCAMVVNNKRYPRNHLKPELKTCITCGKKFKKSTGNKKYCSMKCRNETECYSSKELLNIIKNTFKKLERVPAKREMLGGVDKACVKFFGSWNNAVLAAGLTPNRSHDNRMYKRVHAKALDGHLCDSISELLIDNWLYKNNILHERDVYYPNTHHKADWAIIIENQKIFVEYFGLANDSPRYDRTMKEKKKLCSKNKISLIAVYPQDLYPKNFLEDNLKEKFKKQFKNHS
jgi:signal recognition particle subunit SEC65